MNWRTKKLWHPRGEIKKVPIGSLVKYEYNTARKDGYLVGIVIAVASYELWHANENRYNVFWYTTGVIGSPPSIHLEVAKGI